MSKLLVTLLDEIRPKTIRLLQMMPDDWLLWSPPGTQNHITWHAGHAIWLADVICIQPITNRSELPEGWDQTFGQYCRPPSHTKTWPTQQELIRRLADQHARLRELLSRLSDADLYAPPRQGALARCIIHGLHDEANHQGEMYLLLKLRKVCP